MDLYIETLTGTAFELRVSPFDTVMSIKAKIQRLEGEYLLGSQGKITEEWKYGCQGQGVVDAQLHARYFTKR